MTSKLNKVFDGGKLTELCRGPSMHFLKAANSMACLEYTLRVNGLIPFYDQICTYGRGIVELSLIEHQAWV